MAEYGVVLAVIAVIVVTALTALSGGIGGALDRVTGILPPVTGFDRRQFVGAHNERVSRERADEGPESGAFFLPANTCRPGGRRGDLRSRQTAQRPPLRGSACGGCRCFLSRIAILRWHSVTCQRDWRPSSTPTGSQSSASARSASTHRRESNPCPARRFEHCRWRPSRSRTYSAQRLRARRSASRSPATVSICSNPAGALSRPAVVPTKRRGPHTATTLS